MSIYDIRGNELVVDGGNGGEFTGKIGLADLSEEIVNPVMVIDENTAIINLLNLTAVSVGRTINGVFNQYYPAYRTSDYIPVNAGQTYVAQSWDSSGSTHSDRVELFDADKAYVQTYTTSGNGTIRYCIFTPEVNGFIRYCYTYSETAKPMVFIGAEISQTYVEYSEGATVTGEVYYEIAKELKSMVRRDVEPSNLYGKRVYMIGDSNSDNWSNGSAKELEKRYGCTVIGLGQYGATWATTGDITDTERSNAIGQWNAFIDAVGIDEDYLFPDDVVLLFMMGTNAGSGTFPEDISTTGEDVTTPQGAINHIFKRARYYGRNIAIGVFLPWQGSKNDQLKRAADYYKIPTFDVGAIIADDTPTSGLARPDGTTVSQNYITDGGNHLATWGWKTFERIAHPWIAYEI